MISRGLLADHLELLNSPAPIGFGDVEVPFRVKGDRVAVNETSDLVAGTAEAGQDFPAGVVENMHLLVAAVHDVHELLLGVDRERDPPGRAARIGQSRGSGPDPDIALEVSHLVEDLDAISLTVADVYQAVISKSNAMHKLRECAGSAVTSFLCGRLATPLAQEFAALVEHGDAAIAVAVGDVDIAVARVDHDSGG